MQLEDNQVLIQVEYSGVNRGDLVQKTGKYPAPYGHSQILGFEVYGIISKCGAKVSNLSIGDEVFALVNGGGYADFCVAEAELVLKKPNFLTKEECASIPEVFLTSILNLVEIGQLNSGQTILIHAAASGVGLAAIQLAKLLGANVIATVRNKNKVPTCEDVGADKVLVQDLEPEFALQTDKLGVDLILDPVGGKYLNQNLQTLSFGGKLINIGLMSGNNSKVDLALILKNNLQIVGSTLRNKPNVLKAKLTQKLENIILPAIKAKKIKIIIDKVFDIAEVDLAHEYLKSNQNIGKVLLKHNIT